LTMVCSVDGMNPLESALNIWYVCSFWWAILCSDVSSSYWGSKGWRSPFCLDFFLDPKQEDILRWSLGVQIPGRRIVSSCFSWGGVRRYGILQTRWHVPLYLELKVAHAMVILSALYPALSLGLLMVNQLRFWIEF
jgi:hypothetical protein